MIKFLTLNILCVICFFLSVDTLLAFPSQEALRIQKELYPDSNESDPIIINSRWILLNEVPLNNTIKINQNEFSIIKQIGVSSSINLNVKFYLTKLNRTLEEINIKPNTYNFNADNDFHISISTYIFQDTTKNTQKNPYINSESNNKIIKPLALRPNSNNHIKAVSPSTINFNKDTCKDSNKENLSVNKIFENIDNSKQDNKKPFDLAIYIYADAYSTEKSKEWKLHLDTQEAIEKILDQIDEKEGLNRNLKIALVFAFKQNKNTFYKLITYQGDERNIYEEKDNKQDSLASEIIGKMFSNSQIKAKKNILLIHAHSNGWTSVCGSEYVNLKGLDRIFNFAKALGVQKFDIIHFLSCHMADIETAYELKERTQLIIANPETCYADSRTLQSVILTAIEKRKLKNISLAKSLVKIAVEKSCNQTDECYLILDTKNLGLIAEKLNALGSYYLNHEKQLKDFKTAYFLFTYQNCNYYDRININTFALSVNSQKEKSKLYQALKDAYREAIVYSHDLHYKSLYLTFARYKNLKAYENIQSKLKLYQDAVSWYRFIHSIIQ